MQNKQLKSPPHQQSSSSVVQRSINAAANLNTISGSSVAYGFAISSTNHPQTLLSSSNQGIVGQQQNNIQSSARYSQASGANSGPTRSNDRSSGGGNSANEIVHSSGANTGGAQSSTYNSNSSASNNYYYGQGNILNEFNNHQHNTLNHGGNSYHAMTTTSHNGSKAAVIKKLNTNQQSLNAQAAIQAYATLQQQNKQQSVLQPRKPAALSSELHQNSNVMSPQHNQQYNNVYQQQQQISISKKSIPSSSSSANNYTTNNINRYESLQSKLKNKRRVQPTSNLLGSNSQMIGPGSTSQNNQTVQSQNGKHVVIQSNEPLKFNQTQKIVASAFGVGNTGNISGVNSAIGGNLSTNRKQLKLSLDQHSDSSFNNVSIKSADKHHSVARTAAGLLTSKNLGLGGGLNAKDLSNQISPSSYNGGGSIIQNLTSSQNSVYSSHFSNNSRFRPKNPTDSSSLSSKNSDSLSATGAINILHDIKRAAAQKITNKMTTIQTIKDQQQLLIQQHQQSDSMSDTGEGSFSSNHELQNQQQQKPLSSKLYSNINNKLQEKQQHIQNVPTQQQQINQQQTTVIVNNQIKPSNSIQNLIKTSSQAQLATLASQNAQSNGQQHGSNQLNSQQQALYKSKFTLLNKPKETSKEIKKISQPSSSGGGQGGDSYRRNSDHHQQSKGHNTNNTQKPGVTCGAPFSPKSLQTGGVLNINSKVPSTKHITHSQQQQILHGIVNGANSHQRNAGGGLNLKSTGSVESKSGGTIGSITSQNKKSNRGEKEEQKQSNSYQQIIQQYGNNYEANQNFVKPQQQVSKSNESNAVASTKLNLDQLQNIIKQQQSQHKAMASETIHEEKFEDSEQNTKRESTTQGQGKNLLKQSSSNLNNEQLQTVTLQSLSQKSKSLLTINFDSTDNLKRIGGEAAIVKSPSNVSSQQQLPPNNQIEQNINHAAPPSSQFNSNVQQNQSQTKVEEIKSNPTLQALKEQLKSQIAKQHHAFSNPNQPSSVIEADEIQYPISPQKALRHFFNSLTEYERTEIMEFNEIYFLGLNSPKIKGSPQVQHNLGYDDDRGDYQVVLKDHIGYRYEVLEFLGKGSFGQAVKCYDYKTNQFVAVKIIRNKKRFHHQAGVELKILSYLKENDQDDVNNIIRIKDYSIFRKHLVIAFELLSINLYEFIKNNNFQGISLGLIRRFAIQILQALKYQRDHGIIHCDLKPENILLKQPNKSGIKIIDYGSSCFQNQRIYTYIQSRFYRAPEIVLGIPYTTSIDMWSFGCILAELYTGFPLFPGENEMEQLAYIMEVKGVPEEYLLELSSRKKLFFDTENQPIIVANSRGKKRRPLTKTLKGVLKCPDQNFLEFLDLCLDWDPVNRMTPLEALQHQWIKEGLPPKVLLHHERMFGLIENKQNIKEATLTQIQGFPADAETNSIFNLLKIKRAEAQTQRDEQNKVNQTELKEEANFDAPISPDQQEAAPSYNQNKGQTPQIVFSQHSQASQNSLHGQPKKNKTIQHLVQELFEEKVQQNDRVPTKVTNDSRREGSVDKTKISVTVVDPSVFYSQHNQHQKTIAPIQAYKNQAINVQVQKVTKQDLTDSLIPQSIQQEVPDEDMEEGIHFNKTQKIPISLIKQQEKLPVHQVPFYNPKVNGPKLNNYVTQAAAFSKKTHNSTSNLVNRGYQAQNYSATLAQQTINSSFNHQQNACSVSNFNIIQGGYPDASVIMPASSSRSSKNTNTNIMIAPNQQMIPTSIAQLQLQNQRARYKLQQQQHQQIPTSSIKIDLSNNSISDHHQQQYEQVMKSSRR